MLALNCAFSPRIRDCIFGEIFDMLIGACTTVTLIVDIISGFVTLVAVIVVMPTLFAIKVPV